MDDTEVLKIILESAKLYRDNLVDKNLIIISYNAKTKTYNSIETLFLKRNFLHLTGVKLVTKEITELGNRRIGGAVDFYNLCLKNELKITDFIQADDGTTSLKMKVLPLLMTLRGNLMGDFNYSKNRLVTEKIVGNLRGCMGFVKEGAYYLPNTVLQDDIRDVTYQANSIVCIIEKERRENNYELLRYVKVENTKVKKINGEKVIVKPINHIEGICKLDIVNIKVNKMIFSRLI